MSRTYARKWSDPNCSFEGLRNTVSVVANQNITFGVVLTFDKIKKNKLKIRGAKS